MGQLDTAIYWADKLVSLGDADIAEDVYSLGQCLVAARTGAVARHHRARDGGGAARGAQARGGLGPAEKRHDQQLVHAEGTNIRESGQHTGRRGMLEGGGED